MPQVRGLAFSDILKLFQVLPNLKSMDARLYDIFVEKVESRVEGCSAQDLMAISDFFVDNHQYAKELKAVSSVHIQVLHRLKALQTEVNPKTLAKLI
jgi:hypothetical protein